jgi:hypothetical protein
MKKSNLLLVAALLVLLVSLGMHNAALKATYHSAPHKDPYWNFKPLNIQDFQAIDVLAANKINVQIKPGKYQVWVHKGSMENVKVKRVGKRLQIEAVFPEREGYHKMVLITCPDVSQITTNATFLLNGKKEIRKSDDHMAVVTVEGFSLDSLELQQDNASAIQLTKNRIGYLHSTSGISPGARPRLEISPDNIIREANLKAQQKATLRIHSAKINRLRYDCGDSTEVSFSGSALGLLKN